MNFKIIFQVICDKSSKVKGFYIKSDGSHNSNCFCSGFLRAWCQNEAHIKINDEYVTFYFPKMAKEPFRFYLQPKDLKMIGKLIAWENQEKIQASFEDKEGNGVMTISWKET